MPIVPAVQCSNAKPWVLVFMWMSCTHHCFRKGRPFHGNSTPQWQWSNQITQSPIWLYMPEQAQYTAAPPCNLSKRNPLLRPWCQTPVRPARCHVSVSWQLRSEFDLRRYHHGFFFKHIFNWCSIIFVIPHSSWAVFVLWQGDQRSPGCVCVKLHPRECQGSPAEYCTVDNVFQLF